MSGSVAMSAARVLQEITAPPSAAFRASAEHASLLDLPNAHIARETLPAGVASSGSSLPSEERSPRRKASPLNDERIWHTPPLWAHPKAPAIPTCFEKDRVGWAMLAKGLSHERSPERVERKRCLSPRGLPPQTQLRQDNDCMPRELSPRRSNGENGCLDFLANGLGPNVPASTRRILQRVDPSPHRSAATSPNLGDTTPGRMDAESMGWANITRGFLQHAPPESPPRTRKAVRPQVSHDDAPWERPAPMRRGRRHMSPERQLRDQSPTRSCSPRAPYATDDLPLQVHGWDVAQLEGFSVRRTANQEVMPVRIIAKDRPLSPPFGTDLDLPQGKPKLENRETRLSCFIAHVSRGDARERFVVSRGEEYLQLPASCEHPLARQHASDWQIEEACAAAGAAARRAVERACDDVKAAARAASGKRRLFSPERLEGSMAADVAAVDALKNVLNGALQPYKLEEAEHAPRSCSISPIMRRVAARSQSPKALVSRNASAARRASGGRLQLAARRASGGSVK